MKQFKQCGLAKGDARTIGWIETRGAKEGARVEIDGEFWTVTGVGTTTMSGKDLSEMQTAGRNFKQKTDY